MNTTKRPGTGPKTKWKVGESGSPATQFKPGQSGNPSGRPKNPFPELIRGKTRDGNLIIERVLFVLQQSKSYGAIMHAAEFLRDTGWWKPVQGIRGADENGNDQPIVIKYVD